MELETLGQLFLLTACSFFAALAALWLISWRPERPAALWPDVSGQLSGPVALLFEDEALINATDNAKNFDSPHSPEETDFSTFLKTVQSQFPDVIEQVNDLEQCGVITTFSNDGAAKLCIKSENGLVKVSLSDSAKGDSAGFLEKMRQDATKKELATLSATAESAPFLVWRQNKNGIITWANNSYLTLARTAADGREPATWPPNRLFDLTGSLNPDADSSKRVTAHIPGETEPRWFECFETMVGDESLFTAVSADKVVRAEVALRDFVQTLTKTFAHLTIGLAVFDKQRRLALFNPALTDLTTLSPSFLTGRPTFRAVVDQLREKKMIPEPKDYKSWRRHLIELEAAAANGTYEETWALANGQTFRVTGRPHPDGAVAFLFEDISAEISLTRRFRAELSNGQAVLDTLDQGIAVFSPNGALTLSNIAYSKLWGIDPTTIIGEFGITDATRTWAEKCTPSPVWGDVREFVSAGGERREWSADEQLLDGRNLYCQFTPISGGAMLARFTVRKNQITGDTIGSKSSVSARIETATV